MNMRGMLPGKRKTGLFLVVLVLVMALIAILLWFRREEPKPGNLAARPVVLRQDQLEKLNQDDDEDGLKNWEEAIYRTDPRKKDSDGDGTDDGMEVAQERDPLIPGPNDQVSSSNPVENQLIFAPDNLTAVLAEKIGSRFIVPRIVDPTKPLDLDIGQQLVEETVSLVPIPTPSFAEKDVLISQDDSIDSLRAYDKATDVILSAAFKDIQKPAVVVFSEALQVDDLSKVSGLDKYLAGYDYTLQKTKMLRVPSSLVSIHLRYLNALSIQRESVKKMRFAEADVVKATLGAREFAESASIIEVIVRDLRNVLVSPKL